MNTLPDKQRPPGSGGEAAAGDAKANKVQILQYQNTSCSNKLLPLLRFFAAATPFGDHGRRTRTSGDHR